MNDIMVDLETMGTRKTSVITTLAAVQFNLQTGEIGKTFSVNIDMDSAHEAGLTMDVSTIKWWMRQDGDIRAKMFVDASPISQALIAFSEWIMDIREEQLKEPEELRGLKFWGNSASFDLGILENAYYACKLVVPWGYREEFCYRTAINLFPELKQLVNIEQSNHHVAVEDAKWQSKNLSAIYNLIKGIKQTN